MQTGDPIARPDKQTISTNIENYYKCLDQTERQTVIDDDDATHFWF